VRILKSIFKAILLNLSKKFVVGIFSDIFCHSIDPDLRCALQLVFVDTLPGPLLQVPVVADAARVRQQEDVLGLVLLESVLLNQFRL
jgi:hypothetical protein